MILKTNFLIKRKEDILKYDKKENLEDLGKTQIKPDLKNPGPLYFKSSDEAIKWQRTQITVGFEDDTDDQIFNHMNESGWIDETPDGWRIVTDEEISADYWENPKTTRILFDMKAEGFPDGPDWERYDYTTGGDGLESPTEYWTNKKTGISYEVEAEAVISHYGAEVCE